MRVTKRGKYVALVTNLGNFAGFHLKFHFTLHLLAEIVPKRCIERIFRYRNLRRKVAGKGKTVPSAELEACFRYKIRKTTPKLPQPKA